MRARSRPLALVLALVGVVALSSGCRTGRALIAPPDDYAAFRPVRTSPTLEDRLRAAERYLAAYPEGVFAPDARRFFTRAEEVYFASKRGSVAGLVAYLDTLPRGPHAALARRELDAKRAARKDLLGERARGTEQRLATSAAARAGAREELSRWVARFAEPSVFEGRLGEAPAELVVAWSLSLPAPRCSSPGVTPRACTKLLTRPFSMPGAPTDTGSGEGDRELVVEVQVVEDPEGVVCAVTLAGPAMFSRWEEASSLAPAEEGEARRQAVRGAAAMVRSTFETRTLGACADEAPASPATSCFSCGSLRVVVAAGEEPGADDAVTISRASPCPSP